MSKIPENDHSQAIFNTYIEYALALNKRENEC